MTGIKITKEQGLIDPDVYAQSMGVSIVALMRANPEWRPWGLEGGVMVEARW
jgi:hypothetical protein